MIQARKYLFNMIYFIFFLEHYKTSKHFRIKAWLVHKFQQFEVVGFMFLPNVGLAQGYTFIEIYFHFSFWTIERAWTSIGTGGGRDGNMKG